MVLLEKLNKIMEKIKSTTPLDKFEIALIRESIKKGYLNGFIFAKAITTAYSNLSPNKQKEGKEAYLKLQAITTLAINRALLAKEPFYDEEIKMLEDIFNKLGFEGKRVALAYVTNFNVVFGLAIKEELEAIKEKEELLMPKIEKRETEKDKKESERLTNVS